MAVPAVYIVVGAVAFVAVGIAFKEFVYDPHIAPALNDWFGDEDEELHHPRQRNAPHPYRSDSDSDTDGDGDDDDDDRPLIYQARSSSWRSPGVSQPHQRGSQSIRLETFNDGRRGSQWLNGVRSGPGAPVTGSPSGSTSSSNAQPMSATEMEESRSRDLFNPPVSARPPAASRSDIDAPNPSQSARQAPTSPNDFLGLLEQTHIFDPSVPSTPSTIIARSVQTSRSSTPPPPVPPLSRGTWNNANNAHPSQINIASINNNNRIQQQPLPELIAPLPIRVSSIPAIPQSPPANQERSQIIPHAETRSQPSSPASSRTRVSSASPPVIVPTSISTLLDRRDSPDDDLVTPIATRSTASITITTASTVSSPRSHTSSPPAVQSLSHSYPFHHADAEQDLELVSPPSSRSLSPFSTVSEAETGNNTQARTAQVSNGQHSAQTSPAISLSSAASAYLSFSSAHSGRSGPGSRSPPHSPIRSSRASTGTLSPDIIAPSRSPSMSPGLMPPRSSAAYRTQSSLPQGQTRPGTGSISEFSDLDDVESGLSDADVEPWSSPELRSVSASPSMMERRDSRASASRSPEAFYNVVHPGVMMGRNVNMSGSVVSISGSMSESDFAYVSGRDRSGSESEGWESVDRERQ